MANSKYYQQTQQPNAVVQAEGNMTNMSKHRKIKIEHPRGNDK